MSHIPNRKIQTSKRPNEILIPWVSDKIFCKRHLSLYTFQWPSVKKTKVLFVSHYKNSRLSSAVSQMRSGSGICRERRGGHGACIDYVLRIVYLSWICTYIYIYQEQRRCHSACPSLFIFCTLYIVHCIMYAVKCILYNV